MLKLLTSPKFLPVQAKSSNVFSVQNEIHEVSGEGGGAAAGFRRGSHARVSEDGRRDEREEVQGGTTVNKQIKSITNTSEEKTVTLGLLRENLSLT